MAEHLCREGIIRIVRYGFIWDSKVCVWGEGDQIKHCCSAWGLGMLTGWVQNVAGVVLADHSGNAAVAHRLPATWWTSGHRDVGPNSKGGP